MSRTKAPRISQQEMQREQEAIAEVHAMPGRPQTYHIITYGCQMNAHDSEKIAGMLQAMGMQEAARREEADVVLFNTCCIRDNAERKALGNMTWLKQLKAKRPEMVLCVCGCMMQQEKMAKIILRQYPFFDVAFGTHNLHRLPSLMLRALETRRQVIEVSDEPGRIGEGLPVQRDCAFKAYQTIMYGCDNFCSYCIVPYVRGRERSREEADILREAEALLAQGVQEITLLGQNVNSYGNDLQDDASFPRLLRALQAMGVPRIRFMTSHPKDLSDALIEAIADSPRVARHFHLPVQSGSDAILQGMNRGYTREAYLQRVEALCAAIPDIALTTDLIVGFPGESDLDFADTLSLVRQVRFDSAFTFVFSPREGTRAARMQGAIVPEVAKERIGQLIAVQEEISAQVLSSLVGSRQTVLVEERSRRDASQVSGKCERNITCNFAGDVSLVGTYAQVEVMAAGHNTLKARRVD